MARHQGSSLTVAAIQVLGLLPAFLVLSVNLYQTCSLFDMTHPHFHHVSVSPIFAMKLELLQRLDALPSCS